MAARVSRTKLPRALLPTKALATKFDDDKPPLSLIDGGFLRGLSLALKFGAERYGVDNWRGGFRFRRLLAATLRHVTAFNDGEDLDSDSGLSHLWHAAACLMILDWVRRFRPSLDDRYVERLPTGDSNGSRVQARVKPKRRRVDAKDAKRPNQPSKALHDGRSRSNRRHRGVGTR